MAIGGRGGSYAGGSLASRGRHSLRSKKYDPFGLKGMEAARTASYTNLMAAQADQAALQTKMMQEQYRQQKAYNRQMSQMWSQGSQFLQGWQSALDKPKQMYSKAWENIGEELGFVEKARGKVDESFKPVISEIWNEFQDYKEKTGGLEADLIKTARMEAVERQKQIGQLSELTKMDLAGAAGRAQADVAAQSAQQRAAMAREMAGYGLDPTSGRFAQGIARSRAGEARDAAIAMNLARESERARAAGLGLETLSQLDPASLGQAVTGMRQYRGQLLGMQGDLMSAREQTKLGYTQAARDLLGLQKETASGYAQDISRPYAEMAALQAGMQSQAMQSMGQPYGGGGGGSYAPNQKVVDRREPGDVTNIKLNIPEGAIGEPNPLA